MRRAVLPVVLAMLAAAAAACSDDQSSAKTIPPLLVVRPPSPSPEMADRAKRPITIAFAGDTHFHAQLAARLADPRTALGPTILELRRADFTIANLETAITTRGTKEPKEFNFRAPPSAFGALRAAGVDVVTMANNHGMDYGRVGLRDTLTAIRRSHFPVVGIGRDEDQAFKPYYATVKGTRLAVIGATQVLDDNLISRWTATPGQGGLASAKNAPRLLRAVRAARHRADTVIVYLHWGKEMRTCPLPRQKSLARRLVKAGADVIVGSHAHVTLGGGFMRGRYVDYGMGNFFFYAAARNTADTGILEVTLRGRHVLRGVWKPATISHGVPHLLIGPAKATAATRWNARRRCTGLAARP